MRNTGKRGDFMNVSETIKESIRKSAYSKLK